MAEQAQITSIEAIESFRATLIVYLNHVRPLLEEVTRSTIQAQQWLQGDRWRHWQQELRNRHRKLEEARLELFNARLSKLQEASVLHILAVQQAQRGVHEAEEKLKTIKRWERELDDRTTPLTKQIEQLHGFLATDMIRAVAHLDHVLGAIAGYRDLAVNASETSAKQNVSAENEAGPVDEKSP